MTDFTVNMATYTAATDGKVRGTDLAGVYVVDLPANSIFVDNTLGADITDGSYSIANRNSTGSDGDAYNTIQAAINAVTVGWTILLRDGTYTEVAIDVPESKNGTAWTAGNYTTIKSYPGEWAKVDATGLNTSADFWDQAVFTHPHGYDILGDATGYNEYWLFSNFEITGGHTGVFLKMRDCRFRWMYIHDNGRTFTAIPNSLAAGIFSTQPQRVSIRYCWIADNWQSDSSNANNANILWDSDYLDDTGGEGSATVYNACTRENEVAYNYINGSQIGIRQKNQQRFGLNSRDPNDSTYEDLGDDWHHNIILDANNTPVSADQDFCQIHHNIVDNDIAMSRPGQSPIVYNICVYNNSIRMGGTFAAYGGIISSGGYYATDVNFYDVGAQKTIHEHINVFNNIIDSGAADGGVINLRVTENYDLAGNPDYDDSDINIDRNLQFNKVATNYAAISYYGDPTDGVVLTAAQLNTRIDTARSLTPGTTKNWDNTGSGLWVGGTGTDQYKVTGTYDIDGTYTAADGGITTHPYLASVTPPAYVGAVDPADGAWVDGVHDDVPTVAWLTAQTTDPSWIE